MTCSVLSPRLELVFHFAPLRGFCVCDVLQFRNETWVIVHATHDLCVGLCDMIVAACIVGIPMASVFGAND